MLRVKPEIPSSISFAFSLPLLSILRVKPQESSLRETFLLFFVFQKPEYPSRTKIFSSTSFLRFIPASATSSPYSIKSFFLLPGFQTDEIAWGLSFLFIYFSFLLGYKRNISL